MSQLCSAGHSGDDGRSLYETAAIWLFNAVPSIFCAKGQSPIQIFESAPFKSCNGASLVDNKCKKATFRSANSRNAFCPAAAGLSIVCLSGAPPLIYEGRFVSIMPTAQVKDPIDTKRNLKEIAIDGSHYCLVTHNTPPFDGSIAVVKHFLRVR